MSLFSSAVPTYLYATLLSGQYAIPAIHCNVRAVYTNTTPVDAYRGAGRPEATFVVERMSRRRPASWASRPPSCGARTSSRRFPHQTPGHHELRRRRLRSVARRGLQAADYDGLSRPQGGGRARGKLRGIGMSCYIEACGIAPSYAWAHSAPASACGNPPKCASIPSAPSKC
jgi:carbon-monoxide dehydrogenase large subunit